MMLHTKYQGFKPCGFREDFSCFLYIRLCTTCDIQGGPTFGHRGIILINLVKAYKVMLHSKYQGSRSCGFREDFFIFSPFQTRDPQGGPNFGHRGII